MSFTEEFRIQWNSFSDYMVSDMVKTSMNGQEIDPASVSRLYSNEILRWSLQGQYNAQWLNTLRAADAPAADAFLKTLEQFRFDEVEAPKSGVALMVGLACAGGAIGLGIGLLSKFMWFVSAAACVAGAVAGWIVGSKISAGKKEKEADAVIESYKIQLAELGDRLSDIIRQAES